MDNLYSLFSELLELESPYSLGKIDKDLANGKVRKITFTIEIDASYRPDKYHQIHSYYTKYTV